ncbi:MAG: hypothetical protein H0X40_14745 [Chthoniobacterales bacterium]|nr:hypothetical protein [Chthoniobacterales bacterium]
MNNSPMTKIKFLATLFVSFLSVAGLRAQWAPVSSGTTNNLNGVQLLDSGVGYAAGDAGTILKTGDSGATWMTLTSGTTQTLHGLYVFNDSEAVTVGDNGLILRTTDGGTTWLSVTSGVRDSLRSVSFSGANGICGGTSQDILYSTDSGASWHVSQKGFFGGGFFGAQMLSPTLGFVAGQNSIFQGFVGVTVNGGVNWTFHDFYFNGNEGTCDDVYFFDSATGITSAALFDFTGAIARTINGAVDWSSIIFPQALEGIAFPKPEAGWVVGLGGAILKSSDQGVTFNPQTSGISSDLFAVHFQSDALTGVAVGRSGTILRTTNGGEADSFALVSAASRKGPFEIALPLSGPPGIECRVANRRPFTLLFTFNHPVTAAGDFSVSCGRTTGAIINPDNSKQVLATYFGTTCNSHYITLTLQGTTDDQGNSLTTSVTMGLLLGDVNADGFVDEADLDQAVEDLGEHTDSSNFREDVNVNGEIDELDLSPIQLKIGSRLR